jgi:hypothetical protein
MATLQLLDCIATLLLVQEAAAWAQPIAQKAFRTVLLFVVDPRPKVWVGNV